MQVASARQSSVPSRHSLTLAQKVPVPAHPGWQLQLKPPSALTQSAWGSQGAGAAWHSSTSTSQWSPLQAAGQVQW